MKKTKQKAIFLDRDGVVNKEIGYLYKVQDFKFINGVFKACNYFQSKGYLIIIITNQSGIARGYYNETDFKTLNNWMNDQFKNHGVNIIETFFCPHAPKDLCNCRKPKPGLILDAILKYNIDKTKSWLIGDKETDIKAANLAGITNTVLVKTGHKIDVNKTNAKYILKSLAESVQIIE